MPRPTAQEQARNAHFHDRKQREEAQRHLNRRHGAVMTPDGPGVVVGTEKRKNTNGGPGTAQYRVELDDGRIRHYASEKLTPLV